MDTYSSWEEIVAINRNSIQPLYRQVKEELERWIVSNVNEGKLSPGDRLPSEKELSNNLGVSSITVKRALDELRRQGLIQRIQGRGSFVAQKSHIVLNLNRLFSLTEHVREVGMLPERITLEIVEARASISVARHLSIPAEGRVARLVRLRLIDKVPVALETSYLNLELLPDFLAQYNDRIALYELLTDRFGCKIVCAQDILEVGLINAFESRHLETPIGSLGIIVERTGYLSGDRPLEFTKTIFRGDICSFSIDYLKEGAI